MPVEPENTPLDIETWLLPELVAWIMTRDWQAVSSVRSDDDPSFDKDGAEIIRKQYRTAYARRGGDPDRVSDEITLICQKGRLHTFGRYKGSRRHIEILSSDWEDIFIIFDVNSDKDMAMYFEPCGGQLDLKRFGDRWTHMRFSVFDALENWPGPNRPSANSFPNRRATASAETECKRWLIGLMNNGNSTQSKTLYFDQAHDRYGVSRRGFDRAWSSAIDETGKRDWSRPGRKS